MEIVTESRLQKLLSQLRAAKALGYREQLARRIASLMPYEDDAADVALSFNSLQQLVQFLASHPELKCPTVTVTPGGDMYASWHQSRSCVFSIQFLDSGQVKFVVLRLDSTEQLSGLSSPAALMATVAPLNVLEWAGK
jgi:hypothetical protein